MALDEVLVTDEDIDEARRLGACIGQLPTRGVPVASLSYVQLCWAEDNMPARAKDAAKNLGVPMLWLASSSGYGDGYGSGYGDGSGYGYGYGYGDGSGSGDGDGDGYGYGYGSGDGSGKEVQE